MSELFEDEGPGSDWVRLVAINDRRCGLRAVLVQHSLARGPAFGGVRRYAYHHESEALADAKRLAEAMSLKCALADLAAGGGKVVIFDHPLLDRAVAYPILGQAIQDLGGSFVAGPDLGTGPDELELLRRRTRWVNPSSNDAGRSTAAGVLAGLRGLSQVVFGDRSLSGRRYVIQGLGSVGSSLAGGLLGAGASVAGWDPDPRAQERAEAMGVELLDERSVFTSECDVFMPCALGQVLDVHRCERGPWRAVCGSANNQLATPEAARVLHRRGIIWAPDFVVNAGAVIEGVETVIGSAKGARERVVRGIEAIADRCAAILEQAREQDRSPAEVALERARSELRAV